MMACPESRQERDDWQRTEPERRNARVVWAEKPGNGSAEHDPSGMSLLIVKLNRDFHRAGDIQRGDVRIYLPDDDDAGLGIFSPSFR